MRFWRAGRDDDAVDVLFADDASNLSLGVAGAAEHLGLRVNDSGKCPREVDDARDIHHACDVAAAMANEHAGADLAVRGHGLGHLSLGHSRWWGRRYAEAAAAPASETLSGISFGPVAQPAA